MTDWIQRNLEQVFSLPAPAVEWLTALYGVIQVFDDAADGDPIERAELDKAILDSLVRMPVNQFFLTYPAALSAALQTMVLKWQASDRLERDGNAGPKAYMWRAGYFDVVLLVVSLCHGPEVAQEAAHLVLELYGESLEDYMKEFENA
jgi:hypothetical protein